MPKEDPEVRDESASARPVQPQESQPDLFEVADNTSTDYARPAGLSNSNETTPYRSESGSTKANQDGKRPEARASRRPRSNAPNSSVSGTNGAELERRVARLEFAEGALSRCRVPVFVDAEAGRDVLTDLDVLSVDFDNRLRLSRSMLECKSGRGQSGEGDRLLWLAGLRNLLNVDRAVLVRQTITQRGRALANSLRLQILDMPTLSERESSHAWLPERFAHIDGPGCSAAEARTDTQLRGLGHIPPKLVAFLRHQSVLAPSHRSLTALVSLRRATEEGGVLPLPTQSILAGHALQSLALAALQDAATLDTLPETQLRRRIELALTVGSPDDNHMLSVLGRADQIMARVLDGVHRAYIDQGANRIDVPTPSLRQLVAEPPDWVERYLDLVKRMRGNPAIARQLPQTIELACFDALFGDTAYQAAAFDHLFTIEHRSLILACVRVLSYVAGTQLAEALTPITALEYRRSAPAVPDRTAAQHTTPASTPPLPARRAD